MWSFQWCVFFFWMEEFQLMPFFHLSLDRSHTIGTQFGWMGCIPACDNIINSHQCVLFVTRPAPPGSPRMGCYINGRSIKKLHHILVGDIRHSKDLLNTNTKIQIPSIHPSIHPFIPSSIHSSNIPNISTHPSQLSTPLLPPQEYDYHVLVPAVHLLTLLLRNRTREVQEIVLANPLGISRMMDLLSNQREIVRNEVRGWWWWWWWWRWRRWW